MHFFLRYLVNKSLGNTDLWGKVGMRPVRKENCSRKYLRLSRSGTDICAGMFTIHSLISRPIIWESSDSRDRIRVLAWSVACSLQSSSSRLRSCWTHSRFCFSVMFKMDVTPNTSFTSPSSSSLPSASTSLCWITKLHQKLECQAGHVVNMLPAAIK